MYEIEKHMEIAGSHKLDLNYESKCQNQHGHNWHVWVSVEAEELDVNGMVVDFTHLKKNIHDKMDHQHLNDIFTFNPTAENICKWIADEVNLIRPGINCYKVKVQESDGNVAMWRNK